MGHSVKVPVNKDGMIVCSRCGAVASLDDDGVLEKWNFIARAGYIVGYV